MSEAVVPRSGRRNKKKTILAVLAGGLVLGVGAVVTLAAWQDDEFAHGTFTSSGDFQLLGQVDAAEGFTDHATSPGGELSFDLNASSLAPNMVSYSPYGVELAAGTTVPATVTVTAGATTGTVDDLTYGIYAVDAFTCDAAAVTGGTAVVPEGTAITTVPADTAFDLGAATADAPGAPQYLCLVVTTGDDLATGQSGTATWQFQAASQ
ncbi:SipW-dependent-type signal peptide-containing protein (plasmid) [Curtobacterium sp. TC1]|uniref:SipW-dependent-type signal peptide-containing protein n=1 Tax=Curtobacterium sp. TC1 TaxID=2862880 RepID=UPI001C9BAB7B|nr:SipW-dependent-type signal peptide-containing protein [Curtobacterium sp. TC1]QZQ53628.1 SipW-dependent-type signal peptide-containing protein [Curtobacterium sp. TC1]